MASASEMISSSAGKDDEIETRIENTSKTNDSLETETLPSNPNEENSLVTEKNEEKAVILENGQHDEAVNGEKQEEESQEEHSVNEKLNEDAVNDNQRHENTEQTSEAENNRDTACEPSSTIKQDDNIVKTTLENVDGEFDNELEKHESTSQVEDTHKTATTTTENIEKEENNTEPPGSHSKHRHSPNSGSPERPHHTGGCHKFPDEESRAEYMKIKSEVTGEAETSESEEDEETATAEHAHPGSHTSPDSKTKAEYRKIKYEITGEALTSESEDENPDEEKKQEEAEKEKSSEEWMDVFGNGLLKRRILREGKGRDTRPDRGQIVMIQTAGRLSDGTPVDWNQCLEFILGDGEVIQAWDVGVALIELNEVCELVTDARYAYGEQGRGGEHPVPPNAKITYEIELLAVRDGPDMDTINDEERIKIGDKKKELGNDLFVREDYAGAINCYQRAIKYLAPSSDEKVQTLRMKCWNNLAATQLKIKAYSAALTSCQQVLTFEPDNVKALFRKGKVLAAQGDVKEALSFIKKASQNEPGNKTIRAELMNLRRQLTSQTQQERNMYERMVGGLSEKDKTTSKQSIFSWSLVFGATVVVLGGIVAALYVNRH